MKKLTFDTNIWIDLRDKRIGHEDISRILKWHDQGKVQIFTSNRFYEPDSSQMQQESLKSIEDIFEKHKIEIVPSTLRSGVSALSGRDVLGGGSTNRSREEIILFRQIAGGEPSNKNLADFDFLLGHFSDGRDYFITNDERRVFSHDKRARYLDELGLKVVSPKEFVDVFNRENA